jgi:hypothetical protein
VEGKEVGTGRGSGCLPNFVVFATFNRGEYIKKGITGSGSIRKNTFNKSRVRMDHDVTHQQQSGIVLPGLLGMYLSVW